MKVVSYRHLFGDNQWESENLDKYAVIEDGVKYAPLKIVKKTNLIYEEYAVKEIKV